jgi:TRAP-type C4-dicarboxylate transport system substrate-binding protein
MIRIAAAAMTAALTLGLAGGAAAQQIELKMSHFVAPTHPWTNDFFKVWVDEVNKRSGNKLKAEIFAAGSTFGQAPRQFDQVVNGVVDVANGLRALPPGRFARTSIIEMPFLAGSADAATRALWAMYPKYLAEEWKQVKVLVLHAHNPAILHTASAPVTRLEEIKGLRVRSPAPVIHEFLKAVGADPVGMPPTEIYENLQKGVIGGVLTTWELLHSADRKSVV